MFKAIPKVLGVLLVLLLHFELVELTVDLHSTQRVRRLLLAQVLPETARFVHKYRSLFQPLIPPDLHFSSLSCTLAMTSQQTSSSRWSNSSAIFFTGSIFLESLISLILQIGSFFCISSGCMNFVTPLYVNSASSVTNSKLFLLFSPSA